MNPSLIAALKKIGLNQEEIQRVTGPPDIGAECTMPHWHPPMEISDHLALRTRNSPPPPQDPKRHLRWRKPQNPNPLTPPLT